MCVRLRPLALFRLSNSASSSRSVSSLQCYFLLLRFFSSTSSSLPKMQHWFFKFFYFVSTVIPIVALSKIFAGQVYTRYSDVESQSNSSSWPFEVRLQLINHVCTIPSPNLDLSEEELIAAWQLPLKTRLSDRMREIARCRLAAERITKFDQSKCDCVDSWPIGLVAALIVCACFNMYRFLFGMSTSENDDGKEKLFKVSYISFFIWYVVYLIVVVMLFVNDLGLSYTLYGQIEARSYFGHSSDWKLITILVYVGCSASGVEYLHRSLSLYDGYKFVGKLIKGCFVPKVKKVASLVSKKRSVDEVNVVV